MEINCEIRAIILMRCEVVREGGGSNHKLFQKLFTEKVAGENLTVMLIERFG